MTYRGKLVDPLNLQPEDVDINDIVWALSHLNRFTGHAHIPVSVLAHSILVAMRLPPKLRIYGLLHDASESYISDLNRTVKRALPDYIALEERIMRTIYRGLGVEPPNLLESIIVKGADDEALAIEATSFMSPKWRELVPDHVNDSERMFPMTPLETRRAFMALWLEHGPGKVRVA